jgi:hypothetical protein
MKQSKSYVVAGVLVGMVMSLVPVAAYATTPPQPAPTVQVIDDHWTNDCEAGYRVHIVTTVTINYSYVNGQWVKDQPVVNTTTTSQPMPKCKTTYWPGRSFTSGVYRVHTPLRHR